jgi:hypothetical protein
LKLGSWRSGLVVGPACTIEIDEFLIPEQQCSVALVGGQSARFLAGLNGFAETPSLGVSRRQRAHHDRPAKARQLTRLQGKLHRFGAVTQ